MAHNSLMPLQTGSVIFWDKWVSAGLFSKCFSVLEQVASKPQLAWILAEYSDRENSVIVRQEYAPSEPNTHSQPLQKPSYLNNYFSRRLFSSCPPVPHILNLRPSQCIDNRYIGDRYSCLAVCLASHQPNASLVSTCRSLVARSTPPHKILGTTKVPFGLTTFVPFQSAHCARTIPHMNKNTNTRSIIEQSIAEARAEALADAKAMRWELTLQLMTLNRRMLKARPEASQPHAVNPEVTVELLTLAHDIQDSINELEESIAGMTTELHVEGK